MIVYNNNRVGSFAADFNDVSEQAEEAANRTSWLEDAQVYGAPSGGLTIGDNLTKIIVNRTTNKAILVTNNGRAYVKYSSDIFNSFYPYMAPGTVPTKAEVGESIAAAVASVSTTATPAKPGATVETSTTEPIRVAEQPEK